MCAYVLPFIYNVPPLSSLATKCFTLLACMHWLQRGGGRYCSVVEGGILLFSALQTPPKPHRVEADCKLLHLRVCALV